MLYVIEVQKCFQPAGSSLFYFYTCHSQLRLLLKWQNPISNGSRNAAVAKNEIGDALVDCIKTSELSSYTLRSSNSFTFS